MDTPAIVAEGIVKRFGDVHALDRLDLAVQPGTVLGLLGPNGAGKTTAVRIFTTLLEPDAGRASVAGYDVVGDAARLRRTIGLAGQYAAVDPVLTGRENLELVGRLYHLSPEQVRTRSDAVLERFGLTFAADRTVRTYSGGMRRRLDLAASLVGNPTILFLDEPTTGLDPRSRLGLWDLIRELVNEGTTLLLTTQYLEEADNLAHTIAVIDGGRVIAEGTSDQLKDRIGGEVLELHVQPRADVTRAVEALEGLGSGPPQPDVESGRLKLPVADGSGVVVEAVRRMDAAGITVNELALHRPTLDDVFLSLTGHGAEEGFDEAAGSGEGDGAAPNGRRRRRGRGGR
jgi:ABC-2 type transport system ATP-binding protein